jgi:hypothetical protein
MHTSFKMLSGRCLIIPDVHQDAAFLASIFEREDPGSYDYVLFLGDFFDARSAPCKSAESVESMLRLLRRLRDAYGDDRIRALMGNHDLAYYRNWKFIQETAEFCGAGDMMRYAEEDLSLVTAGKMIEPEDEDDPDSPALWRDSDWEWLAPMVLVNGFLISHAGIHPAYWPDSEAPLRALDRLRDQWSEALEECRCGGNPPLLSAGKARGGLAQVGGWLWCDWEEEFLDGLPFPQIVGHSADNKPRQKSHVRQPKRVL